MILSNGVHHNCYKQSAVPFLGADSFILPHFDFVVL